MVKVILYYCRKTRLTNAQDATGLNQPVLSHYLARLEDVLGVTLCERGRGGFMLTNEGKVVYQEAKAVMATLEDFSNRLLAVKHQLIGNVRLGCLDNTVTHSSNAVSKGIRALYQQSKDATMTLEIGDYTALMDKLRTGDLDIALSVLPDDLPTDVFFQPIFIEHSYFYTLATHTSLIENQWRTGTLDPNMLMIGGHALYEISKLLGPVAKKGLQNTAWHLEGSLLLMLAGTHVGFLPDHYAEPWVKKGKLAAIAPDELKLNSTFYLIRNVKQRLSPVAEALWNHIVQAGKSSLVRLETKD